MKNLKDWYVEVVFKDGIVEKYQTSSILNSSYRDILTHEIHIISQRWGLKNVISIKFAREIESL